VPQAFQTPGSSVLLVAIEMRFGVQEIGINQHENRNRTSNMEETTLSPDDTAKHCKQITSFCRKVYE
jgi:hypothetical protein